MISKRHAVSTRSQRGLVSIAGEPGDYLKETANGLILILVALAALIAVPTGGASHDAAHVVQCKPGFHRVHKTHPARWVCVKNRATPKPVVRIDSHPASPSASLEASFVFSSSNVYSNFKCSLDGGAFLSCTSPISYGPLAKGNHTFAVKALSGNPTTFRWTIANPGGDVGAIPAALAAATTVSQAEQDLRDFFAQYHMAVAVTNIQPSSTATYFATWSTIGASDLPALKTYGELLIDEWAKYPLDFVARTGVKGIALVSHLQNLGIRVAAMPDPGGSVMYYDVAASTGSQYARSVVHHEFDHLLTYNIFGGWAPNDPTWVALNPPGFHYSGSGAACYVPPYCPGGPHVVPGFVSGYATSAIEEDKAETFAYLMETADYRILQSWITTDTYLAAKVAHYKQFLCSLSSAMCGNYFDSINGSN